MKRVVRKCRRDCARMSAEPMYFTLFPRQVPGETADQAFVTALATRYDERSINSGSDTHRISHYRYQPLGCEHMSEAIKEVCLRVTKDRGPRSHSFRRQITYARQRASDDSVGREMLCWLDAFYTVALCDLDMRSALMLSHESSFRSLLLATLRVNYGRDGSFELPPHFSDEVVP